MKRVGIMTDDNRRFVEDYANPHSWLLTAENLHEQATEMYSRRDRSSILMKRNAKGDTDRTAKHFMVPVIEIQEKDFDLSINRYKETAHEAIVYDPPKKIIARLRALEAAITEDLSQLEGML